MFPTVFGMDGKVWDPAENPLYGRHLERFLKALLANPDNAGTWRFLVYFHPTHRAWPDFPMEGNDTILILLSDEAGVVPSELSARFFAILKTYWPLDAPKGNIIPMPLGTSNSVEGFDPIPFHERRYDVSFTGNFVAHRLDFYRQFTALRWLPPFPIGHRLTRTVYWTILKHFFRGAEFRNWLGSSRVYFSGGFGKGLPPNEYAETLVQSRIALCPRGFISTECWRLYEAMKFGCVIVADELPPSRWYRDSPIVIEKNWLNIRSTVAALLADPSALEERHQATLRWWNDVCSEEASAKSIAAELESIRESGLRPRSIAG
jgi:hypothetical protein